ncbi:phosphoglycerate dehydrogenase [candidate division WOR-1 bacterium RIFOXYA12_FULL_43_27]|uniref:D-3-phosphoglycerate dehydrogenase n=1 Tax=candidate division WOR-1 bacterium RIFOXYC2_FULL_46_14 TaxID=1802587 RepID=A0A1F4U5Q4_UNCSA|nr:MAG: phosphoglycerate dehydrogenase [candidate division WOR-1 bacterium RIFOXYA12_FULL_43_27]OGC20417.1 MAG: phosphoglycerate dehydrogenase [candidate division WOR-1 bacterium RIFOXYB2_FULL_46_45]OGC31846.1 MAG: phosphoglycerate dehydrogenase [candidate division WOR-1 bacterium RIFOXYA2_FULL_46_56]OGC40262.1 MAG: phosphoglycerate dehydrogenase [candidate division WOR-1 bacterium RIFOXYC2_FULL_46_14]
MKVLASDKIAEVGLKMLKDAGIEADMKTGLPEDELVKIIGDYEGLVIRSDTKVTPKIIEAANKLKIIGRAGVGVDNVDLPSATKRGIIVVNSPEGNTIAAAEHTIAMLMSMSRYVPQACSKLKAGKWDKKSFKGIEVFGKTLGVLGLGKIGRHVASCAIGLGMKVAGYDPFISEEYAKSLGIELTSLDALFAKADFITLHLPKNKETLNLINKDSIAKMKKGVRILNVARGGIINEKDLYDALKSGQVAAAAIDVFEKEPCEASPLFELDNVIVTPHLGASTEEAQVNVAIDVVEQIIEVLKGGIARSPVNIPSFKAEVLQKIQPFIPLAEKLGSLAGQLIQGGISKVEIAYSGEIAEFEVAPLTSAALKGMLEPLLGPTVNFVNAQFIAKERKVEVTEKKQKEVKNFASLIVIKIVTDKATHEVGGTVFGKNDFKLVNLDGFSIDASPVGYLLVLGNIDRPGMIGKVGSLLGKHNINIASMDVGRQKVGEKAVMVLNIDNPVAEEALNELKKIDGIFDARLIKFA